jgi:hypothetical protein
MDFFEANIDQTDVPGEDESIGRLVDLGRTLNPPGLFIN